MYHKWQSCDVWFLKYGARQTELFIILDYFLPFYPSNKEQKTNKQTNTLGDIIFLHMCTINENHMICGFWNMGHNWQKFLSFWTIVCPFTPLTSWTIKIMRKLKKNKHTWRYYHFTHVYHNWKSWFMVPGIWSTRQNFCHWAIFCPFIPLTIWKITILKRWKKQTPPTPPYNTENQNHEKKEKKPWDITILHVYHKWKSSDVWFLRQGAREAEFFHFGPFFAFLSQKQPEKSKFWKNEKNLWIYHHFTLVYQKSWSYAMLFLRYSAWRMWFLFSILDYFLSFYPPDSPKNQN